MNDGNVTNRRTLLNAMAAGAAGAALAAGAFWLADTASSRARAQGPVRPA